MMNYGKYIKFRIVRIVIIYLLLEKDNNSLSYQKNLFKMGINLLSVKIILISLQFLIIISFEN